MLFEKCGLFAICGQNDVQMGSKLYKGLSALQHRGQYSAGAVFVDKNPSVIKGIGLVDKVFSQYNDLLDYCGRIALGHVCYGKDYMQDDDIQPLIIPSSKGTIYIAYNGCISLTAGNKLETYSMSDIAYVGCVIKNKVESGTSITLALKELYEIIKGAFCIIVVFDGVIYCLRDQYGFKPMCYGKTCDEQYVFASETCALNAVGVTSYKEIKPGELVICDGKNIVSDKSRCEKVQPALCSFEYIYLASKDSFLNGTSVTNFRYRSGKLLARSSYIDCDLVIGVPRSGIDAAKGYAEESGLQYGEGIRINNSVLRTFISPNQVQRELLVKEKLSPITETIKGKNIVVVDDSIVRGTTAKQIVKMLRDAGAIKIHYRVASPCVVNCCNYGVDICDKKSLLAYGNTIKKVQEIIDADSLSFLELNDLCLLMKETDTSACMACFNGFYPDEVKNG